MAAHFVAKREPFSRFPAGDLIRTLSAQIRKGHYLFALDPAVKPVRVVRYLGWALYDHAVAERFAATGVPPSDGLPTGGDVVWILTAVAEKMGVRHKAGGKRVKFDQSRARIRAKGLATIVS